MYISDQDNAQDCSKRQHKHLVPGTSVHLWLCQGVNLATNAFLRWSLGSGYSAKLLAIMEMPKQETHLSLDFSSLLGPIFYCWLSQLLLPLLLVTLVYEKQRR